MTHPKIEDFVINKIDEIDNEITPTTPVSPDGEEKIIAYHPTGVEFPIKIGYSGYYSIVGGSIRIAPAVVSKESNYSVTIGREEWITVPGAVQPDGLGALPNENVLAWVPSATAYYATWSIDQSDEQPSLITISGEVDLEDPYSKTYQIPITPYNASVPEWVPNAPVRAYAYKLLGTGGSREDVLMEGTIISNVEAVGSDPSKVICSALVV